MRGREADERVAGGPTAMGCPASIDARRPICQPACQNGQTSRALRAALPLVLFVLLALPAACAPAPQAMPTPTPAPAAPAAPNAASAASAAGAAWETDPVALVEAERNAAAARDAATLATLWAEDAVLVEHRGAGPTDDYRWQGRAAILDRYAVAVFPAPPPPLDGPLDAAAQIDGDRATLVNGVDRWRFAHRDGRWWITGLEIGAPGP